MHILTNLHSRIQITQAEILFQIGIYVFRGECSWRSATGTGYLTEIDMFLFVNVFAEIFVLVKLTKPIEFVIICTFVSCLIWFLQKLCMYNNRLKLELKGNSAKFSLESFVKMTKLFFL